MTTAWNALCRLVCLSLVLFLAGIPLRGQTAHPIHGASVITADLGEIGVAGNTQSFEDSHLIAVDSHGTVFVNDPTNRRVLQLQPNATGYKASVLYTLPAEQVDPPESLLVDGQDALYLALAPVGTGDPYKIVKFTPGGSGYTQSVSVLPAPRSQTGIVVLTSADANGVLYGTAADGPAGVIKLVPSNGGYSLVSIAPGPPGYNFIATVLTDPHGDGSTVYGIASLQSLIYTYSRSGNAYTSTFGTGGPSITSGSLLNGGSFYTASQFSASGNNDVLKVVLVAPLGNATYQESVLLPHLHRIYSLRLGMALDAAGDFFVEDGPRILKYAAGATDSFMGPVYLGANYLLSVQFQFDATTTLGAKPYQVLSYGKENGDFAAATDPALLDDNVCVANHTYQAGEACSVRVYFQPTAIGHRAGTVALLNTNGAQVGVAGLTGIGQSAHPIFDYPAESVARSSGFLVGADPVRGVYVYDPTTGITYKDMAAGDFFTESVISSTAGSVVSVATDSTGAILIADQSTGQIVKEVPKQDAGYVESVIVPNLSFANRISPDASGGFFTLEQLGPYYDQRFAIAHYAPVAGSYQRTELYSSRNRISDIAADSKGNVYALDGATGKLSVLVLSGNLYQLNDVATIDTAYQLAVDIVDAVEVMTGNAIIRVVLQEDGTYSQTVLYSKPADPYNPFLRFAIAANGDVFLQDTTAPVQLKALSTPGPLSFASTAVGATSSDSPRTIQVTNVGASALQFSVPASGSNPSISSNFALGAGAGSCPLVYSGSAIQTLAPAASCTLAVSFTPTDAGTIKGSLTLSDNDPSAPTQTIPLSGLGAQAVDHLALTVPGPVVAGQSVTVTVTAYSDSGTTVATNYSGPVHFRSVDAKATLPADGPLSHGVGTFSVTMGTPGAQSLQVELPGGSPSATAEFSVSTGAAAAVTVASGSGQVAAIGEAFSAALVVTVTDSSGNPVAGKTVSFSAPASGSSAVLSAATGVTDSNGQTSVKATANGLAATQQYYVTASVSGVANAAQFLLVNRPHDTTVTLQAAQPTVLYGAATPVTVTATISPATAGGTSAGGAVYFFDGAGPNFTYLPSTPHAAVANGKAVYTFPGDATLPVGQHSYNVYYSGDNNFGYSVASTSITVLPSDVTVSGNAQNYLPYGAGGSVPFAVTFASHAAGVAIPTGTVQYTLRSASNANLASGAVPLTANGDINSQGSVPVSTTLPIGSYTIDLVYPGDAHYNGGTVSLGLQVTRVTPAVTLNSPMPGTSRAYGQQLGVSASAVANSASVPGVFGYTATPSGGTAFDVSALTVLRPGVYTIAANFTPTDTTNYASASASASLTITKANPTLYFADPAPITDDIALSATQLNATVAGVTGGDVVGTFAYTPPAGTKLSAGANQVLSVTFTPGADDANLYNAVTATAHITVNARTAQTITFAQPADHAFGDSPFTLAPTSSSGLPVTLAVSSGPATLNGYTVTLTGAGTVTLTASQAGNTQFEPASSVARTFSVGGAATTTQVNPVSGAPAPTLNTAFGLSIHVRNPNVTPLGTVTVSEGGAQLGTGTLANGDALVQVTLTSAGAHSLTIRYVPTNNSYLTSSASFDVSIAKTAQTITFAALPAKTYGDAAFTVSATASSGLPVTFTALTNNVSIAGNTVTIVGGGTALIGADQSGDGTFDAATQVIRSFNIAAIPTAVTPSVLTTNPAINQLTQIGYTVSASGLTPAGSVTLSENGTKLADGALSNGTGFGYVKFTTTGTHTITVDFTPANSGVLASTATIPVSVGRVAQTVSFSAPLSKTYGDAPIVLSATASSGLPVTFGVASGPGSASGSTLVITGAGTISVVASQAGDATYAPATATQTISVLRANSAVALTSSSTNANQGAAIPYSVAVSGPGALPPSGTVSVMEGTTTLGTGTLSGGTGQVTIASGLSAGAHVLTLAYGGDANYFASTITFTQTVAAPAFSLVAAPDPLIVQRGASSTATLTLTPVGGYKGTLTLQCGSLPAGVTCTFSPATYVLPGDNAVQTGTLKVTASTNQAALETGGSKIVFALLLPGAGMLLGVFRRRKLPMLACLLVLGAGSATLLGGCGAASSNLSVPGNYPVTLTAADSNSNVTVKLTIIIQQ